MYPPQIYSAKVWMNKQTVCLSFSKASGTMTHLLMYRNKLSEEKLSPPVQGQLCLVFCKPLRIWDHFYYHFIAWGNQSCSLSSESVKHSSFLQCAIFYFYFSEAAVFLWYYQNAGFLPAVHLNLSECSKMNVVYPFSGLGLDSSAEN